MNGKDILLGLQYVDGDIIEEAEFGTFRAEEAPRLRRLGKPFLVAAILAGMMLLAGCGTVVYRLITAESPLFDLPLLSGEDVNYEDIKLTAKDITPSGLHLYCEIDDEAFPDHRVAESENAIFMLSIAPITLERKTDGGWEALPKKIDDAQWMPDEVLTGGHYDWLVSWSGVYGYLEPGVYRLTTQVIEGLPEASLEFTIEEAEDLTTAQALDKCNRAMQALMDQPYYHTYSSFTGKFGDLSRVPEGVYLDEDLESYSEQWKAGADYLELGMRQPGVVIGGMMKKDGIKYQLDNEDENDSTTPIAGWSVWPALEDERLASWHAYSPEAVSFPEGIGVVSQAQITFQAEVEGEPSIVSFYFDPEGNLTGTESVRVKKQYNGFDAEMTYTNHMEVLPANPQEIDAKFAQQNVNFYRPFSWEADRTSLPHLDIPFQNTTPSPVATAPEAIALAMKECAVEYTKIVVYRDEAAGIWKVEFQILYGYQGYQYIYMDNDGMTQMISGLGSKVEEWKTNFPDPA